jgi:hypothetical protein
VVQMSKLFAETEEDDDDDEDYYLLRYSAV